MQKKLLLGSLIILALTSGLVIFYPQLFGCKSYHAYEQYRVYFCGKDTARVNIAAIDSVLNQTELLLKKTQFSSVKQPFKLFFRNKNASYINWPFQFSKEAYAQTIPFFHNIFVWNSDFQTNNVFIPSGHQRPLASVLAHEIVHVLYENQYGWRKILENWLNKHEKSSYGFMWKKEGYRWSRYLVIDFSHPWLKSTRQRAKLLAATVLRPSRFTLNEQTFASHNDSTAA